MTRIIQLVEQGFYNGTAFHRVVPNFVIQGGDPTLTGTGGSGRRLQAEFNDIRHIKGTVAMARGKTQTVPIANSISHYRPSLSSIANIPSLVR